MRKLAIWAGWIVVALAGAFFVSNGVQKLLGSDYAVAMFHDLGLPAWMRIAVGVAETAGGLCLLIPRLAAQAAAFLGLLMLGAVGVEFRAGHRFGALIPAQWVVLFALVFWVLRRRRARAARDDSTKAMT